jgi:hypothetical protein
MRALLEEGVAAVAMAEVVVLPWLSGRGCTGRYCIAVEQYLDGAEVAGEVPGVSVGPGQGVRGDLGIVLSGFGAAMTDQACSSNSVIGSLTL